MKSIDVALRIDIDTVKDAEMVPLVIELLDGFRICGTFFVTTGVDNTYKNFRNNLNPLQLRGKISRYGVRQMFRGLISREHVERTKALTVLVNSKHEVGLHGHDHFDWMNHLDSMSRDTIRDHFEMGIRLFEEEFGAPPRSFASPGFKVNDLSLEIMESFDFTYASDFLGSEVSHNGTLQIPVALPSIGEMKTTHSDTEIMTEYSETLNSAREFVVFYIHPSQELVFDLEMVKKLLYSIKDNEKFNPVTMSDIAENYRSGSSRS